MKRNSLLKNTIFGFLSWFLPLGLSFVATPLIVRGLGVEEFGIYSLILGFVSYSFTFNVGRAIVKYVSEFQAAGETEKISEVISATLTLNLIVGGLGMAILVFFAKWFVINLLKIEVELQNEAVAGFYFASAIIFMTMLNQSTSAIVQAVHRFDIYSYITVGTTSMLAAGNIILIGFHPKIETLLIWNLAVLVLSSAIFYCYAKRLLPDLKLTFRFPKEIFWLVVKYSAAIAVFQILGNVMVLFERVWITNRLGTKSVAYYVISLNLGIYIHAFITSITLALFPLASEVKSLGDTAKLLTLYTKATKIVLVLAAFLTLTMVNARIFILHLWLGDDFVSNSSETLLIHALTFGILAVFIISFQTIEGAGFPNVIAVVTFGWVLISIPLMIIFIDGYGIRGVAAGRFFGEIVFIPAVLYIENKVFGKILWGFWLKILPQIALAVLLASIAQILIYHSLQISWINLLLGAAVGGLVYGLFLFLAGIISAAEKKWLKDLFDRKIFKIS